MSKKEQKELRAIALKVLNLGAKIVCYTSAGFAVLLGMLAISLYDGSAFGTLARDLVWVSIVAAIAVVAWTLKEVTDDADCD